MDDAKQQGQQWLTRLLHLVGAESTVQVQCGEAELGDSLWLVIDASPFSPDRIQALIGVDGDVLDAIQYLANTILNLGIEEGDRAAYTVELNGYRQQRQEELKGMARQAAERVRETGQEVEMTHLSAAERRQVHNFFETNTPDRGNL
ncbi:MAG: RNA-binding protein, partial [Oscillatoriales cyanobacterium SM2_2_1]|nr:RNA-binding protein [Oscillatoriales cyanobacterium SM2_2_1]